jgi:hypothetical protein
MECTPFVAWGLSEWMRADEGAFDRLRPNGGGECGATGFTDGLHFITGFTDGPHLTTRSG